MNIKELEYICYINEHIIRFLLMK